MQCDLLRHSRLCHRYCLDLRRLAVANYLNEHEKQQTKVELARLEMEAKKEDTSN